MPIQQPYFYPVEDGVSAIFCLDNDFVGDVSYKKGYYHLDETEDFIGPFITQEVAMLALREYKEMLNG